MKELEGKVVAGLAVSECAAHLRFELQGGAFVCYEALADCCSESWFSDITGVSALLGQRVRAAERVELPDYDTEDGRCLQEVDQAYGYQLQTAKGRVDIVFRNSSNGYYGGELCLREQPPKAAFFDIEDDWMGVGGWPEDKALAVKERRELEKAAGQASRKGAKREL